MSDPILDIQWINHIPFDSSQPGWASDQFQGKQFFRDESPIFEWTPVLHPDSELEQPVVGLSGRAVRPRLSDDGAGGDLPFTHMFGNDWTVDVVLDERYRNLLAIGNTNGDQPRLDPDTQDSITIAEKVLGIDPATNFGTQVKGVLHCEIDRGLVPAQLRALEGDRIAMLGRWIVDTGHNNPYGAEMHPPLLLACARPISSAETYASVVVRPYLSSQLFGSDGLRKHIDNEIVAVELDPFKVRVEARPNPPYTTPFAGIVLAILRIRPPTPRASAGDTLAVQFHFTARPGVALQVGASASTDDSVSLIISMNDVNYLPADLPPRHDRFVNPDDLAKAQPDVGEVLKELEGLSILNAFKPWAGAIFARDILTDSYESLQAISARDSEIHTDAHGAPHFSEDTGQPFPLYGWITVRWQGQPVFEMGPWHEVAGGGVTDAAVTAKSYGGRQYLFQTGMNDHIYVNVLDDYVNVPDDARRRWGGWAEVPGGGTTDAAVAAEVGPDDNLYLFARGINDGQIYMNVMNSTQIWSGWQQVPGGGTTDAGLSAVTYGSRLYLFAKGIDRRIYVNAMDFNGVWSGWGEVSGGGTTDVGLASAAGPDGRLYLFGKGIDDRRIYQNLMNYAGSWSGWHEVPGGGTTDVSLGVCRYGSRLYLLRKGSDDHGAYVNMMEAIGAWSGWTAIPGNATTPTSLSGNEGPDGALYLFHIGMDQRMFFAGRTIVAKFGPAKFGG